MRFDDNQDVYASSEEKGDKSPLLGGSVRGKEAMKRSWRISIAFMIIMLILFSLAVWFALVWQKRDERPDLEPAEFIPEMYRTNVISEPAESITSLTNIPDPFAFLDKLNEEAPTYQDVRRDPEKLALAMDRIRVARQYAANQEWEKSEQNILEALKEWPNMVIAQRALGMVLTQTGQYDKAMAVLLKALKNDPFAADLYSNLAAVYMHKGMFNEAEDMLRTALRLDPNFHAANINLGVLYLATGRYSWAVDYLEEASIHFPGNLQVRNNLAVSLLRIGRYEEARGHLDRLVKMSPDTAYAYFNMAITYALERDFENAMTWIKKGAEHCSPLQFHHFVSDRDFEGLRAYPEFVQMVKSMFGENLPARPSGT